MDISGGNPTLETAGTLRAQKEVTQLRAAIAEEKLKQQAAARKRRVEEDEAEQLAHTIRRNAAAAAAREEAAKQAAIEQAERNQNNAAYFAKRRKQVADRKAKGELSSYDKWVLAEKKRRAAKMGTLRNAHRKKTRKPDAPTAPHMCVPLSNQKCGEMDGCTWSKYYKRCYPTEVYNDIGYARCGAKARAFNADLVKYDASMLEFNAKRNSVSMQRGGGQVALKYQMMELISAEPRKFELDHLVHWLNRHRPVRSDSSMYVLDWLKSSELVAQ